MDTTNVIDRVSNGDREVYTATMAVIDSMSDGDNKAMDDLTEEVAETISREPNEIKVFVTHFAKGTEEDGIGYVSPGRYGGYRKGIKPAKRTKKADKIAKIDNTSN